MKMWMIDLPVAVMLGVTFMLLNDSLHIVAHTALMAAVCGLYIVVIRDRIETWLEER